MGQRRQIFNGSFEGELMARLVVGILIGLVLGLYLDSAGTGSSVQLLVQIQTAIKNLISF
jgi:hypothetical protein